MLQAVQLTRMVVSLTGDLTIYGKVEEIDPNNPDRVPDFCPREMKAHVNRQELPQGFDPFAGLMKDQLDELVMYGLHRNRKWEEINHPKMLLRGGWLPFI